MYARESFPRCFEADSHDYVSRGAPVTEGLFVQNIGDFWYNGALRAQADILSSEEVNERTYAMAGTALCVDLQARSCYFYVCGGRNLWDKYADVVVRGEPCWMSRAVQLGCYVENVLICWE